MQGYWTGCYGPHGLEIIYLRLAEGCEPGEQHCPCAAAPRLVCMKVPVHRLNAHELTARTMCLSRMHIFEANP